MAAAPAGAATPPTVVAPGSNRGRWIIALGVAGVAIAVAIGAMLMMSSPTTPEALRYVPGDSAFVAELRMDMPGDQMQNLGNLLAHFPGFADQSTLPDKVDEALSQFVDMVAGLEADYRTDLKPWLNGALFVGAAAPSGSLEAEGSDQAVVSATTNGAVSCTAAFEGQTVTNESYRGLDLVLSADGSMACVVDGRQALIGSAAMVRKALDAKADGSGMDKRAEYASARTALGGDRLATLYVDGVSLQQLMPSQGDMPGMPALSGLTPTLPAWMMAGIRAEDDALVFDAVTAPIPAATAGPSLLPMPAGHASLIAPLLPSDTLAYLEVQGAGVALQNLLTQLRVVPELAQPLAMLEGLGGAGGLVGWIDDVGVAFSMEGQAPEAALILIARDDATASSTVSSLTTMLALAGFGGGIVVSEETINGVQVTTVIVTDLGAVIPPGSVPGMEIPPMDGPISFSIAARGRAVVLAFGDGAMAGLLATSPGSSLVDTAAFKQAAERGIANSQTTMYVAAGATIELAKGFVPAEELAQFEANLAPYLDPLEAVLMSASNDATGARSRIVITVTTP
ncbi:MAG TPA: DUF3352 domain-containing protein [Candidatus Limnocylindria bacterium]|nr:DUF3352 domain-containing protein [Candidatus Limnocylindria bacterium]